MVQGPAGGPLVKVEGLVDAPTRLVSDQKLADLYATAQIGEFVTVTSDFLLAISHELLWHRGQHGGKVLALKLGHGAKELPMIEVTQPRQDVIQ